MTSPSPKVPFGEQVQRSVNNDSPAMKSSSTPSNRPRSSPGEHQLFFPDDTPWQMDPEHTLDSNTSNDENTLIHSSYSYSPSKPRRGSLTSSPFGSSSNNNSQTNKVFNFYNSGKAKSMDSSMIAAMRHHRNLIDITATRTLATSSTGTGTSGQEVEDSTTKLKQDQDLDQIEETPSVSSSLALASSSNLQKEEVGEEDASQKDPSPSNGRKTLTQGVKTIISFENPFADIQIDETPPGSSSLALASSSNLLKGEAAPVAKQAEEDASKKGPSPSNILTRLTQGVKTIISFENPFADIQDSTSEEAEMSNEKDSNLEETSTAKDVDDIIQVETVNSWDSTEPAVAMEKKEDMMHCHAGGGNNNLAIVPRNPFEDFLASNDTNNTFSSMLESDDDSFGIPQPGKLSTEEVEDRDAESQTESSVITSFSPSKAGDVMFKSPIEIAAIVDGLATTPRNNSSLNSTPTKTKSSTTPKSRFSTPERRRNNIGYTDEEEEAAIHRRLSMSPKDRYLHAIRRNMPVQVPPMSPKDRYLHAVRQAAAKCKVMVATPREIVTGPNPTPKCSVKAQIKRVQQGREGLTGVDGDQETRQPRPTRHSFFDDKEARPTEYGSPMFANESLLDAPLESGTTKIHPKGAPSAFHSFHGDELPVKEEIEVGSGSSPAKSYLQLDLEAPESVKKEKNVLVDLEAPEGQTAASDSSDNKTNNGKSTTGPMSSLRNSIASIWHGKPKPIASTVRNNDKKPPGSDKYASINSPKTTEAMEKKDTSTPAPTEACCEVPDEATGITAMESFKSSFVMMWNNHKSTTKLLSATTSTHTTMKTDGDANASNKSEAVDAVTKTKVIQCEELPDGKRIRLASEDSDASPYRRSPSKKTRHDSSLLSAERPGRARDARLAMGGQYLAACERSRSPSGERTITPYPSGSFDSVDLGDDHTQLDAVPVPPLDTSRQSSSSRKNSSRLSAKVKPIEITTDSSRQSSTSRLSTKVKPIEITTDTDEDFIAAALAAKQVNDMAVMHSGKSGSRDWRAPNQERIEHDTMVRAILERPSLIDKSIKEKKQTKFYEWSEVRKWIVIGLAMLVFVATIIGCLTCGITGNCSASSRKAPTEATNNDVEEVQALVLELPPYTHESLKSPHSAQTKAYVWLENDNNRNFYSDQRMLQRFALATLYFSTKIAQNWTSATSWLSYDLHECYWFSSFEGIEDICDDEEYTRLVLKKNNLRGQLPAELALLTSLVEIDLSHNVLLGPLPTELGTLTKLEKLLVEKNELNGEIPSELGLLTGLTDLALATNDFVGTIPVELAANLTNLERFRLFYNFLTGTIPTQIGALTKLHVLDVDVNHLSGRVPTEIGLLENLQELWLDWNNFVGPIPTELGQLGNLVKLFFGRAFVEGELRDDGWKGSGDYTIPSELGRLTHLQELYLDNNNLTGLIPSELSSLTSLQKMTLDNNLIADSISPGICALFEVDLESLSIDCPDVYCSCGCTCV